MNILRASRWQCGILEHRGTAHTVGDSRHGGSRRWTGLFCVVGLTGCLLAGCSESSPDTATTSDSLTDSQPAGPEASGASPATPAAVAQADQKTPSADAPVEFKPLTLSAMETERKTATDGGGELSVDDQIRAVINRLQPLQILLGQWRGTTRREFENFKAVDNHEWVWDLRTNPSQPALVIRSDKSPYVRTGRLTWDSQQNCFVLTATDGEGKERRLTGDFSEAPHEITGSDDKQHRVFRLELNEERVGQEGEQWQLAFAQQENNRYLLELGKRRGGAAFARYDTVSTQREGTSFALSDTGYAERTCIISEGLGTTELTWKGRSYWVCCSGCKAAFEEDPDRWIALAAERSREKP